MLPCDIIIIIKLKVVLLSYYNYIYIHDPRRVKKMVHSLLFVQFTL